MSDQIVAEDVWAADMLYGSEPSSAPPTESNDDVVAESARASAGSGVRGESFELESASRHEPEADVNAGAKRTAIALGAGVACAVALTAAVLMTFRDTAPAPQTSAPTPVLVAAPPPQPASAPAAESDQAISYTASANCPTGSTSAQALTDTTGDSAWVCVRGLQGATVDGQVLHVDFGRSYVLSAVSVMPGWVAKAPGGKDEWLQHRVVSPIAVHV